MAQFDVYRLAGGELALDVQTDLLSGISTRVVIPLLPLHEAPVAHPRLNPIVMVEEESYVVVTQSMGRWSTASCVSLWPTSTSATTTSAPRWI
jgi:toxin CcdB